MDVFVPWCCIHEKHRRETAFIAATSSYFYYLILINTSQRCCFALDKMLNCLLHICSSFLMSCMNEGGLTWLKILKTDKLSSASVCKTSSAPAVTLFCSWNCKDRRVAFILRLSAESWRRKMWSMLTPEAGSGSAWEVLSHRSQLLRRRRSWKLNAEPEVTVFWNI